MRAATCTPVDFPTDGQFFGRDTGLLCRGFQSIGVDCLVVMPGDPALETHSDVIRTTVADLESSEWWKNLGLDLVVLYAWGDPRHMAVATAIRTAGIKLIQSLDTAGLTSPYGNTEEWWQCLSGMISAPFQIRYRARLLLRAGRDFVPLLHESMRVRMLAECDALSAVSEPAARSVATYVEALGQPEIADKLFVVPHAVVPSMVFRKGKHRKKRKVLVVGRWLAEDRAQKDPELTIAVIARFLREEPDWTAEIVGRGSGALEDGFRRLADVAWPRLTLTESIPREQLVCRYQESSILLCASRFESFHISSAEAVCCGCSIIVANHPLLGSTGWFTTMDSGRLAAARDEHTLATALREEAAAWHSGEREATAIAEKWSHVLHAEHVAGSIIRRIALS